MIASREMAAKPAAVWKSLQDEGAVVVTRNGQPEGVFFASSASGIGDASDGGAVGYRTGSDGYQCARFLPAGPLRATRQAR